MPANSWKLTPGVNHVGAYQVSGKPYATGSIDARDSQNGGSFEVSFPYITRWFQVINKDVTNDCRVGFSHFGVMDPGS